jgi:hypothetical protein
MNKYEQRLEELENFIPTVDQINALPKGLRKYVHNLETICDHTGIVAENMVVKDLLIMLGATNAKLREQIVQLTTDKVVDKWVKKICLIFAVILIARVWILGAGARGAS